MNGHTVIANNGQFFRRVEGASAGAEWPFCWFSQSAQPGKMVEAEQGVYWAHWNSRRIINCAPGGEEDPRTFSKHAVTQPLCHGRECPRVCLTLNAAFQSRTRHETSLASCLGSLRHATSLFALWANGLQKSIRNKTSLACTSSCHRWQGLIKDIRISWIAADKIWACYLGHFLSPSSAVPHSN